MPELHSPIESPLTYGATDLSPVENIQLFPIAPATLRAPARRVPSKAPETVDPFDPQEFRPRWWPGQDPSEEE